MPVLVALAAAAFLSTIVIRMTDPLAPLLAHDLGVPTSDLALLATAFGAQRFLGWTTRPVGRKIAGLALTASAILTLAGPWLVAVAPGLHAFLPFDCTR